MTLLRASSDQSGLEVDLEGVIDPAYIDDVGVPAGAQLLAFVNAAQLDQPDLPDRRDALEAAVGRDGLSEAAATVAIFNGLVRIADGTGIELDAGVLADSADFRKHGIDDFAGAANQTTAPRSVGRSSIQELFA